VGQALLGGTQVIVPDPIDAGLHLPHLLPGVGIGDLEVLHVIQESLNLVFQAIRAAVDPAAHLALNHFGIL